MSHGIGAVRRALAQRFREAGLDSADLDARILVGHALGLDHAKLAVHSERPLTEQERQAIDALGAQRLAREPVARILGAKEFWGLTFALNADTLVPRPDTETIVEAALSSIDDHGRPLRIADLGTGSGALLLALLSELPAATGIGTDISSGALACARNNAAALGLAARAAFIACDYGAALSGPLDLVVSNPPYIAHDVIATLDPEVRDFDPALALNGGQDGLTGYRAIAADAARLLAPKGVLVLELGAGMRPAVEEVFTACGLAVAGVRDDLSGIPRALSIRRMP